MAAIGSFLVLLSVGMAQPAWPTPASCRLAAEYSREHRGLSLVVMSAGKTVFEEYHNGQDASRPHFLASGTKSFSGLVALAAVEDGLLSLEEPVYKTLSERRGDPRRGSMTVRQLLTLTGGLPGGTLGRAPTFAEAAKVVPVAEPGMRFQYGPVPFQVFGELMNRKLAAKGLGTFESYARQRLLEPIGIEELRWRLLSDGNPQAAGGAACTAREWARFGEFVRLRGMARGRRLLRAELFDELSMGTAANPAYGLTWWLNRRATSKGARPVLTDDHPEAFFLEGGPSDMLVAAGAGQQRLYVVPSLGLTVVRQGRASRFRDSEFLSRLLYGRPASRGWGEPSGVSSGGSPARSSRP